MTDASDERGQQRDRWEASAPGWDKREAAVSAAGADVARWLVDAAELSEGNRVLEVAAGLGEVGLMAAERVGPSGEAWITDGAEGMVEAAVRRAAASGLTQVKVAHMEAEWLDAETASFDAVISRWGYMLVVDPEAALREARRVLAGGGRIALAAWTAIEENPWMSIPRREFEQRGLVSPPRPDAPDPFRFAAEGRIAELLLGAGFLDVRVEAIDLFWPAADLDDWWEHMRAVSSMVGKAAVQLTPAEHYELRETLDQQFAQFVTADGTVQVPGRTWVARAEV